MKISLKKAYLRERTILHKVWPKGIGVGESESAVSFSNFATENISLKKAYLRERTILYKVWRKVIGVSESECAVSFSNFVAGKIILKKAYLRKRTIQYKVWPKVIEVGESKPAARFSKFTAEKISLKEVHLREITIFYFFKVSWILFIKWNVRSSDIKWSGKLLKKVVYVEVFLSFLETKSWGWVRMKIDHQLRRSTKIWKRLAASGGPEGCRRTTSRWFRRFIENELYDSVMWHLECFWKQFHQDAIIWGVSI